MLKGKIFLICLLILMFAFYLHLSIFAIADNSCEDGRGTPTVPGDYKTSPEWYPPLKYDPNNPDEITCGLDNAVTIKIVNGIPPFTWADPGNSYIWESGTTTFVRGNKLRCKGGT